MVFYGSQGGNLNFMRKALVLVFEISSFSLKHRQGSTLQSYAESNYIPLNYLNIN